MAYTLDDLPLEFRPKKLATTMVFVLIIALEVGFAANFEMTQHWSLATFFTKELIATLSFGFMIGACVWGIVQVVTRKDRLLIDETGVVVHLNGLERRYPWAEMARFHLVRVHKRTKLYKVAIEPIGAESFDARASVIWPRFGPSTEDFLVLLRAGKARWGPKL